MPLLCTSCVGYQGPTTSLRGLQYRAGLIKEGLTTCLGQCSLSESAELLCLCIASGCFHAQWQDCEMYGRHSLKYLLSGSLQEVFAHRSFFNCFSSIFFFLENTFFSYGWNDFFYRNDSVISKSSHRHEKSFQNSSYESNHLLAVLTVYISPQSRSGLTHRLKANKKHDLSDLRCIWNTLVLP